MSRTKRKDKEGNVFWDGNPLKDSNINYRCRCSWCTGIDRRHLQAKIADKEIKIGIEMMYGHWWNEQSHYLREFKERKRFSDEEWEIWEDYQSNETDTINFNINYLFYFF